MGVCVVKPWYFSTTYDNRGFWGIDFLNK